MPAGAVTCPSRAAAPGQRPKRDMANRDMANIAFRKVNASCRKNSCPKNGLAHDDDSRKNVDIVTRQRGLAAVAQWNRASGIAALSFTISEPACVRGVQQRIIWPLMR
jgi:hypothetical protein